LREEGVVVTRGKRHDRQTPGMRVDHGERAPAD
jgi:hypothetical protein